PGRRSDRPGHRRPARATPAYGTAAEQRDTAPAGLGDPVPGGIPGGAAWLAEPRTAMTPPPLPALGRGRAEDSAFEYLIERPESTPADLVAAWPGPPQALTAALARLASLGMVSTVPGDPPSPGEPARYVPVDPSQI